MYPHTNRPRFTAMIAFDAVYGLRFLRCAENRTRCWPEYRTRFCGGGGTCGGGSSQIQFGSFSASSRLAKYQSTVRRKPSSNSVCACQPSSRSARLASTRLRGCPLGRDESQTSSPSKPTIRAIVSAVSRIVTSRLLPRLRGSALVRNSAASTIASAASSANK